MKSTGECVSKRNDSDLKKIKTVGLIGPFGTPNLGNEATLAAVIQNLSRLEPGINIIGFSNHTREAHYRHKIPIFPLSRQSSSEPGTPSSVNAKQPDKVDWKTRLQRYRAVYRLLKGIVSPALELAFLNNARRSLQGIDLLMVVGTGVVTDSWGGPRGFPYTLYKWSLMARLYKVKLAFVSVGAGPIQDFTSKRLLKAALDSAEYRSFRDPQSKALVESIYVTGDNAVCPDLVFSLNSSCGPNTVKPEAKTIVLHGLPYRKPGWWENPSFECYHKYLQVMTEFAGWLLERGYTVRLVPTQLRMDPVFIQDMQERLQKYFPKQTVGKLIAEQADDFEQVMTQLSTASIVIASRFHCAIFSYLLSKPVLAVSYHSKMRELMKGFGQENFCADIESLVLESLIKQFKELEGASSNISMQVANRAELNSRLLKCQYETLLRL
jgi:polysaccharide pyruvyl transferase WcaK-like protein